MTEKSTTILYEEIPYEDGVKMLRNETVERLNHCGFGFSGYNIRIPGFVAIPVKFSKIPAKRKEQLKELEQLGYKKASAEMVEKYRLSSEKPNYMISIKALVDIHNVTI